MGQQEVYELLRRHRNKWFSAREIAEKLKMSSGSLMNSLKKLRKSKTVNYKLTKRATKSGSKREIYVYGFRK